jgi:predicted AlkP superfamily pyrophosphatase or phosphodiesterase
VKDLASEAMKGGVDLLWVQLLDVDDAGHQHGPLSSQGVSAAGQADFHLKEIATAAYREGYAIMVLADHGQHTTSKDDGSIGGTHGTDADEDVYVPFIWCTVREIGEALGLANNGASVI